MGSTIRRQLYPSTSRTQMYTLRAEHHTLHPDHTQTDRGTHDICSPNSCPGPKSYSPSLDICPSPHPSPYPSPHLTIMVGQVEHARSALLKVDDGPPWLTSLVDCGHMHEQACSHMHDQASARPAMCSAMPMGIGRSIGALLRRQASCNGPARMMPHLPSFGAGIPWLWFAALVCSPVYSRTCAGSCLDCSGKLPR